MTRTQENQVSQVSNSIADEILEAHNRYRAEVDVPSLSWSNDLANQAQDWANYLASTGTFDHSGTPGQGENLWRGTSGAHSLTNMVDRWGNEKQFFKGGIFSDVSSTGNWADVGHYTQTVWRETSEVGCGVADGNDGKTYLVCRYTPPGNFEGQPVY